MILADENIPFEITKSLREEGFDVTSIYESARGLKDDLKDHFIEHPQWGTLDLYQALIMLSAHCARHTLQLEEVMANPNFPKQ